MPVIADIKLKIDEFAASMRRILDYFAEVGRAAKEAGKNIKDSFSGSGIKDALKGVAGTKQKGISDLFSASGGRNIINILSGVTKAFQGGTFAAEGFVATGLNMVARSIAILGPEFALFIAGVAGTAVAFKAFGASIRVTIDSINQYQQTAAKAAGLGIQTRTLVILQEAFKRVGGDAYAAATALDKFYANLYAAKDGATDVYNALRVLSAASGENLLPVTLLKTGNEAALLKTIAALQQVTNETQRLAIANKLFTGFTGTSGLYLKAIIDKSVIDQTKKDLSELLNFQSMTGGGVQSTAEYFKGLFSIITTGASAVGQVLGSMLSVIPDFEKSLAMPNLGLTSAIKEIALDVSKIFESLRPIIELVITLLYGVVDAIAQIVKAFVKMIAVVAGAFRIVIDLVLYLLEKLAVLVKYLSLGLVDLSPTFQSLRTGGEGLKEKSPLEPGGLITPFAPVQAAIASSLTRVGGGGESFGAGATDPLYDLARQQLETQRQIRDALNRQSNSNTSMTDYNDPGVFWQ